VPTDSNRPLVAGVIAVLVIVGLAGAFFLLSRPQATQGCLHGEYQVLPTADHQVTAADLSAIQLITEHRLSEAGIAGAVVSTSGTDRMVVDLPCVENEEDVRRLIGSTGQLDFVPIPKGQEGVAAGTVLGTSLPPCPTDLTTMSTPCVLFSADQIDTASAGFAQGTDQRAVDFTLKSAGADLFDEFASVAYDGPNSVSNQQFAIVVDGTVVSAPTVNARSFGGKGQIWGQAFTAAEINNLVTVLQSGALPLPIEEVSFVKVAQ
jgi:preprotein translocase subunit SecD